ncbi:hypothetical protein AB0B01_23990 [Streptomyces sp. NPDC044571]
MHRGGPRTTATAPRDGAPQVAVPQGAPGRVSPAGD